MSEPIRVLCVVTQMNRAGMENRLIDIYRNIDHNRIQFDFYTFRLDAGQYDNEILSMGGKIYYNAPISIKQVYSISGRFAAFFRLHHEYRIVHAHMNQWCGLILKGAEMACVPVRIAHSRTALQTKTLKNAIKNLIKLPTNRYATHYFAVSKYAGHWLYGSKAMKQGRVEVWPNAIDSVKFQYNEDVRAEVRNELKLDDSFTIMHVGNLRPEKNHSFLLNVCAKLINEESNSKLVLVGKDESGGTYTKLAAKLGISDKVLFLGSRNDIPRLLQAGDVFVFPSLYEGLPGAVMEAQAAGLPCIVSDTITKEICITPLVEQLPLSISAEKWAVRVLARRNEERENTRQYFEKDGFDIHSLVERLTEFYVKSESRV